MTVDKWSESQRSCVSLGTSKLPSCEIGDTPEWGRSNNFLPLGLREDPGSTTSHRSRSDPSVDVVEILHLKSNLTSNPGTTPVSTLTVRQGSQ